MNNIFNKIIAHCIPILPKAIIKKFAMQYVAGENSKDALNIVKKINNNGFSTTLDILGEHTEETLACDSISNEYISLLDQINKNKLNCNLSIKPTHIGLDLNKKVLQNNFSKILKVAQEKNNFIRIDMENSSTTTDTIALYNHLKNTFINVGIVFQAYLFRTENDLNNFINNKGNNIRLCKGIYNENNKISFKGYEEINENYLKLLNIAFKNKIYVGIATHDFKLLEGVYKLIKELDVPKDMFEFQVLYGVPMSYWLTLHKKNNYKVRIYVPYGKDWHDYSIRRLKENPNIAGYILSNIFKN